MPRLLFSGLIVILVIGIFLSLGLGVVTIDPTTMVSWLVKSPTIGSSDEMNFHIFLSLRLPRVLMAMLVGAALATAGAGIQGIFRNPLADPGLIGISSGASFSAALYIVVGAGLGFLGFLGLSLFTFLGAAITALLIYLISKTPNGLSVSTMLLAGIAISSIAGAGTGLLTYLSDENQLRDLTFWLLGSMGGASWEKLQVLAALTLPMFILLLRLGSSLNAYALGEEEAAYLGLNVKRVKVLVILSTTLLVGASVAVSGIIGFVGLVVPHMIRVLFGNDHRWVLSGSMVLGATLLIYADLFGRLIISPAELPIGIITAAIGAPVFLSLLLREKQQMSLLWT